MSRHLSLFCSLSLLLLHAAMHAEEPSSLPLPAEFPRVAPLDPDESLGSFECQHGFTMQLVASEPLVVDPVDMAYDEDGRAYVVEMRDYPFPEEKNAQPTEFIGRVRLLSDENGDGVMDKSTIFADKLAWPTSVCCWKGGVFVAAAPDIWFFKDTSGDGKADERRKVFTGFSRYNVQAIMNNLKWGLDHRIYGAAAGNGGNVRLAGEEHAKDEPVTLSHRDFRFDPVTESLEATSGGERYGSSFDDWGNRFLCNIRNPVQHAVLPAEYLARNPHLVVPRTVNDAAEFGDQLEVFRISEPEAWRTFRAQRWSLDRVNYPRSELIGAGFWTSSSGATVYRGGAYPPGFQRNVFIGEVAGNLVHRQILFRDGVTFKSFRADPETEFVRSTDNWFRPVNFVNAPDGCLHVLDMYRETIEHPWSIPDDIKAKLDLASGNDRGRIYRLAPPNFDLPAAMPNPPTLSEASTQELVTLLESPHGWWRDTAHRLLYERQDKSAEQPLRTLLFTSKVPQARLHALWSLEGLGLATARDVQQGLRDAEGEVRVSALRIWERHQPDLNSKLEDTIFWELSQSKDAFVRFQLALSAGNLRPQRMDELVSIARRDAGDEWMRGAIVSSCAASAHDLLARLMMKGKFSDPVGGAALVRDLAYTVGARGEDQEIAVVVLAVTARDPNLPADLPYAALAGLARGLRSRKVGLESFVEGQSEEPKEHLTGLMSRAIAISTDGERPLAERVAAMELFPYFSWELVREPLLTFLSPQEAPEFRRAAFKVLASRSEKEIASELTSRWKEFTPPVQEQAMQILLTRPDWLEMVVAALESDAIPAGRISIPHRARILATKDAALLKRAEAVLGSAAVSPRKEVIEKFRQEMAALTEPGDPGRGATIYARDCAACHKLGEKGYAVGPNLGTIRHRSPDEIVIHILDPNREVSPDFVEYNVLLADGRTLTGLIASETDAGLTLRQAEGREETIVRREIELISSGGKSLMPEGMEQKMTPQEMADLVGYLLNTK